jgi:hypothetical protein
VVEKEVRLSQEVDGRCHRQSAHSLLLLDDPQESEGAHDALDLGSIGQLSLRHVRALDHPQASARPSLLAPPHWERPSSNGRPPFPHPSALTFVHPLPIHPRRRSPPRRASNRIRRSQGLPHGRHPLCPRIPAPSRPHFRPPLSLLPLRRLLLRRRHRGICAHLPLPHRHHFHPLLRCSRRLRTRRRSLRSRPRPQPRRWGAPVSSMFSFLTSLRVYEVTDAAMRAALRKYSDVTRLRVSPTAIDAAIADAFGDLRAAINSLPFRVAAHGATCRRYPLNAKIPTL